MKISYIIAVYNKENFIRNTLESIIFQDRKFNNDAEIILVDDKSTDNSVKIIKEIQEQYDDKIKIKLIKNHINCGPSVSLNNGCKIAIGDYLLFIDSDDILINNAEKSIIEMLRQDKKIDYCIIKCKKIKTFFNIYKKNSLNYNSLINYYNAKEIIKSRFNKNTEEGFNCQIFIDTQEESTLLTQLKLKHNYAFIVKSVFFKKIGYFNSKIFVQDVNVFLKMGLYSDKFAIINNPKFILYFVFKDLKQESKNLKRQHNCGLDAYLLFLKDFAKDIGEKEKIIINNRINSIKWKIAKHNKALPYLIGYFVKYILSKIIQFVYFFIL